MWRADFPSVLAASLLVRGTPAHPPFPKCRHSVQGCQQHLGSRPPCPRGAHSTDPRSAMSMRSSRDSLRLPTSRTASRSSGETMSTQPPIIHEVLRRSVETSLARKGQYSVSTDTRYSASYEGNALARRFNGAESVAGRGPTRSNLRITRNYPCCALSKQRSTAR